MLNKSLYTLLLFVVIHVFFSCNSLNKTDNFIGNWELAKSGNEEIKLLGIEKFDLVIEKKDQFYIVKYKTKRGNEVIDYYDSMKNQSTDSMQKVVFENMFRYTLTDEKNSLVNVLEPLSNNIQYKENEGLICFNSPTFGIVWLSRKQ